MFLEPGCKVLRSKITCISHLTMHVYKCEQRSVQITNTENAGLNSIPDPNEVKLTPWNLSIPLQLPNYPYNYQVHNTVR